MHVYAREQVCLRVCARACDLLHAQGECGFVGKFLRVGARVHARACAYAAGKSFLE